MFWWRYDTASLENWQLVTKGSYIIQSLWNTTFKWEKYVLVYQKTWTIMLIEAFFVKSQQQQNKNNNSKLVICPSIVEWKLHNRERIASSNGAGKTEYTQAREWNWIPTPTPFIKISSKWTTFLNVRPEI